MTDAVTELQVKHNELCAKAHGLGIAIPDELASEFDTEATGAFICGSLEKLIRAVDTADSTTASDDGQATTAPKVKSKRKSAAPRKAAPKQEPKVMTATATKKKPAPKAKKAGAKKPTGENKTAQVMALMKRAKGVTREEVLELTGWKAVSMQQLARSAGVKMKVDESVRPFHYKAA
jgi:hypothetical protein